MIGLLSDTASTDLAAARSASLWQGFARGVRDNLLGEVAVQGLRVGGVVFFAHKLAPSNFGLLKIVLIISMFATLVCESGIPDALIQRKDLAADHETTAWWLVLCLVSVTTLTLYLIAPFIERMMALKHLSSAIRLICVPLFLDGTAIVSIARLSRSLRFGALALADVLAEAGFLIGALALLWHGRPEWSLIGGLAARLVTHASVVWAIDRHLPSGLPRIRAARDLSRFATSVLGGRIITIASGNADFLLVGRLLGSSALGYYSMAWDLLRFVPDRLHRVAGRVALPTFCRLQDDNQELSEAYCAFIKHIGRAVLPIAGCVAIAAPEILTGLYGRQWLPAAVPLRMLAIGLSLTGLRIGIGPVYYSKGFPSIDIFLNGTRLILVVSAVVTTIGIGLAGVSAAVSTAEAAITFAGQYIVCVLTGLRAREVVVAAVAGLRVALACMVATLVGKAISAWSGQQGAFALATVALFPTIVFFWIEGGELRQMVINSFKRVGMPEVQLD